MIIDRNQYRNGSSHNIEYEGRMKNNLGFERWVCKKKYVQG